MYFFGEVDQCSKVCLVQRVANRFSSISLPVMKAMLEKLLDSMVLITDPSGIN